MKLSYIKNILLSNDNIAHILEYINIPQESDYLLKDSILTDLLENIFKQNIENFKSCKNKSDIENVLTNCNKTVIVSLNDIIERNTQLKDLETIPVPVPIQKQIHEPVPVTCDTIPIPIPIEQQYISVPDVDYTTLHLFSNKCNFENGNYIYDYNIKNVNSIYLKSFKIKCSMYNINESNNGFYIIHNSKKQDFYIPFGYYSISNLTECMNQCISDISFGCEIYYNNIKNRVYIDSDEKISITFSNNLNNLLGFSKKEYTNNNKYISENNPCTNIFDDIYIKLLLNDKEVFKTITNKESINYYEYIHLNLSKNFGKNIYTQFDNDYFNFPEKINVNKITIQLYVDELSQKVLRRLEYDFILIFEKSS
jgi:hypothetical protein